MNALLLTDAYKCGHPKLQPDNTQFLYSNTTPRKSRVAGVDKVVVFGIQYFVKEYLISEWNNEFFELSKEQAVKSYERIIEAVLGKNVVKRENLSYLHDLGYLPIKVKALSEGTLCPIGVPLMTIINTDAKCGWLTNYLETLSQTVTWLPITSATTAFQYKKLLTKYAEETSSCPEFVQWQAHDFSMRGMSSVESAKVSGSAHLTSFTGTDSIPAIPFLEKYYGADVEKELIGGSVWATEHSNECAFFNGEDEEEYITHSLFVVGDDAVISLVADGFDYWKFLTVELPKFKDQILARSGKLVCRPDSGVPLHIICGYRFQNINMISDQLLKNIDSRDYQQKYFDDFEAVCTTDGKYFDNQGKELTYLEIIGSIEILYEIFGGSTNDKGFIELSPQIGLIYGDSITYDRCEAICERLIEKGFATTNVVFGIGSYTYQHVTRDTYGLACKATYTVINGKPKEIFKDPKTDGGMKKSAKGLLKVVKRDGELMLEQNVSKDEESGGELLTVFENGDLLIDYSLTEIRTKLNASLK